MNTNRVSFSNTGLQSRVKKYDRYRPRPVGSAREYSVRFISDVSGGTHNSQTAKSTTKPYKNVNPARTAKNHQGTTIRNPNTNRYSYPKSVSANTAQSIALRSVTRARTQQQSEDTLVQQFTDEKEVVYTPVQTKTSRLQKAMYVFGAFVFLFSALTSMHTLFTNQQAQDQIATLGVRTDAQGVSEGTGSEPSEDSVSDQAIAAYQVANPEDPLYLRIPKLSVFARIKNLGVDSQGAVDAPWNINDAGWYNGSARPGNAIGSSLILGHVSGWTNPGVFKNLQKLGVGEQFEIEKGSGEIVRYEVVRTENIPLAEVNMAQILSSEEKGVHDLKLMTCAGKYNRDAGTYEDRFVTYAKQIK